MKELKAYKDLKIRFSEVSAGGVVTSLSYAIFFEDAREEFGREYALEYMRMARNRFTAPLVMLTFKAHKPMLYEKSYRIDITYIPTEAAKIVFNYNITDIESGETAVTGSTTQVFMDENYQLLWYKPDYYHLWQKRWEVLK